MNLIQNVALSRVCDAKKLKNFKNNANMPKHKSEFQRAAGKLISSIQKEWGEDLGGNNADTSEDVMNAAHELLQATTAEEAKRLLGAMSVRQYLGDLWVQRHPDVRPAISALESIINSEIGNKKTQPE